MTALDMEQTPNFLRPPLQFTLPTPKLSNRSFIPALYCYPMVTHCISLFGGIINKILQTEWLKQKNYFLTILEVGKAVGTFDFLRPLWLADGFF